MEILLCSKKGGARLSGGLKEDFLEEVALFRPLLKRGFEPVEMGIGEGRAVPSEVSMRGSGVGTEGGHEACGVLSHLESEAVRGHRKHA